MTPMISMDHEGATLFAHDSKTTTKQVVLALHGGLANHLSALRIAAPIDGDVRIVAPDLRASGRSIFSGSLDWKMLARDLSAWLDHLRVERAVLLATSMGTGVALRFALDFPERCAALVLVSPVYLGNGHPLAAAQREAFARMDAFADRAMCDGIAELLPIYDALPLPIRDRARAMAAEFDPASVAATTRFLKSETQPFDSLEDLRQIITPALIVPGVDAEHPAEIADAYARALPNARIASASRFTAALPAFLRTLAS